MSQKKQPTIFVSSDEEGSLRDAHDCDSSNEGQLHVVEDTDPISSPPSATLNPEPPVKTATIKIDPDLIQTNNLVNDLPMWSDFPGECNFSFFCADSEQDGGGLVKNSWEYLPSANQIFIKPDKVLLIHFVFDCTKIKPQSKLFIRAVPVYCSTQYMHIPVDRCKMHWHDFDPTYKAHQNDEICMCGDYNLVGHIVRCVSRKAIYCYNASTKRHSVLLPDSESREALYTFHCKNSCPSGMQRRPIKLVFTLENKRGDVFGRCSVNLKICSCPRRDKERLEKDQNSKGTARPSGAATCSSTQGTAEHVDSKNDVNLNEQLKGVLQTKRFASNKYESKEKVVKKLKTELKTVMMLAESIEKRCSEMEEMINLL